MKELNMKQFTEHLKKVKRPEKQVIRKMVICLVILAGASSVGAFVAEKIEKVQEQKLYEATYNMVNATSLETGITLITKEEATQIALKEAGIKQSNVKFLEVQLEQAGTYDDDNDEDDRYENLEKYIVSTKADNYNADYMKIQNKPLYIYEVSFIYNGLEYSFAIDGTQKNVLNLNIESLFD